MRENNRGPRGEVLMGGDVSGSVSKKTTVELSLEEEDGASLVSDERKDVPGKGSRDFRGFEMGGNSGC